MSRSDIRTQLRALVHLPHVIYYRTTDTELVIIRVLHGKRDRSAILVDPGFNED